VKAPAKIPAVEVRSLHPFRCVCSAAPKIDAEGLVGAGGKPIGVAIYCLECAPKLHAGGRTIPIAVRAWNAVIAAFLGDA
jgi:hypothetical protein